MKGIRTNISLNSYRDNQNITPCANYPATQQYRIKYKLKENVYYLGLNKARKQMVNTQEVRNQARLFRIRKSFFYK